MRLKDFYKTVVKKGIDADVRTRAEINSFLEGKKRERECLNEKLKKHFDEELLVNPFADTRILFGDPESNVKSIIVGVDVGGAELLLADRLKQKGAKIDLAVSHHPQGKAYACFYDVMDLQVDIFSGKGVQLSASENLVHERKLEVYRKVSAANHSRSVDIARLLGVNFFCMHTPCDNLAYQYVRRKIRKAGPKTLNEVMNVLYDIPEYICAAKNNNAPQIVAGRNGSRCDNIHFEFTGGTESPRKIYEHLSSKGVDTIIAMHLSEAHVKKCKEHNINVIFASHIASDSLGINLMLDHLEKKSKLSVIEFSGFRRFARKSGR